MKWDDRVQWSLETSLRGVWLTVLILGVPVVAALAVVAIPFFAVGLVLRAFGVNPFSFDGGES